MDMYITILGLYLSFTNVNVLYLFKMIIPRLC